MSEPDQWLDYLDFASEEQLNIGLEFSDLENCKLPDLEISESSPLAQELELPDLDLAEPNSLTSVEFEDIQLNHRMNINQYWNEHFDVSLEDLHYKFGMLMRKFIIGQWQPKTDDALKIFECVSKLVKTHIFVFSNARIVINSRLDYICFVIYNNTRLPIILPHPDTNVDATQRKVGKTKMTDETHDLQPKEKKPMPSEHWMVPGKHFVEYRYISRQITLIKDDVIRIKRQDISELINNLVAEHPNYLEKPDILDELQKLVIAFNITRVSSERFYYLDYFTLDIVCTIKNKIIKILKNKAISKLP